MAAQLRTSDQPVSLPRPFLSAARGAQSRFRRVDNGQIGATIAEARCVVYAANLTGANNCIRERRAWQK